VECKLADIKDAIYRRRYDDPLGVGMWQLPPQQLIEVVELCERLGYDQ
jgi:hypothetical protein